MTWRFRRCWWWGRYDTKRYRVNLKHYNTQDESNTFRHYCKGTSSSFSETERWRERSWTQTARTDPLSFLLFLFNSLGIKEQAFLDLSLCNPVVPPKVAWGEPSNMWSLSAPALVRPFWSSNQIGSLPELPLTGLGSPVPSSERQIAQYCDDLTL